MQPYRDLEKILTQSGRFRTRVDPRSSIGAVTMHGAHGADDVDSMETMALQVFNDAVDDFSPLSSQFDALEGVEGEAAAEAAGPLSRLEGWRTYLS